MAISQVLTFLQLSSGKILFRKKKHTDEKNGMATTLNKLYRDSNIDTQPRYMECVSQSFSYAAEREGFF